MTIRQIPKNLDQAIQIVQNLYLNDPQTATDIWVIICLALRSTDL